TKDHPPETDVRCTSGATVEQQTFHVPYTKCWRVILKMLPPGGNSAPVDLDCTLRGTNRPVTETWTYRWNPLPIGPHSEVVDSRFSPPVENHNP
ncbi:MAG TPA: glucan biosynthesis protein, partial [Verrucomicrobiae bacterium]|nr:glucan biosynthesis protein [Verrucomicrobiae bacterium]